MEINMKSKRYTPFNKTREELIEIFEQHPFLSNSDIGEMLHVSRERIRQLKKQFGMNSVREYNPEVFREAIKCIEKSLGTITNNTFSSIPNFGTRKLQSWMDADPEVRRQVMYAKNLAYQKAYFPSFKVCVVCDTRKPISEFYPDKNTRDKHNRKCNPCNIATVQHYYKLRDIQVPTVETKTCSMLKELGPLPASFFYRSTKTGTGLQYSSKAYMDRYAYYRNKYRQIMKIENEIIRRSELNLLGNWRQKVIQEATEIIKKDLENYSQEVDLEKSVG